MPRSLGRTRRNPANTDLALNLALMVGGYWLLTKLFPNPTYPSPPSSHADSPAAGGSPAPAAPSPISSAVTSLVSGATNYGSDPTSHAADPLGAALWASQHGDSPDGYYKLDRNSQVTWNSVAIRGH